jgi:thiamine biosynthesis lipoprotein
MEIFSFPFRAMASLCEVRIASTHFSLALSIAQKVIEEVNRIEVKYSRYRSDSIVSIINLNAGLKQVKLDVETCELLNYAQTLFDISEGLFDISSGVLRRAWDFRKENLPRDEVIELLLPLVAWGIIERDVDTIFLPKKGMEIDFGGFGKEYAADRVAFILQDLGVRSGLVNLGGDIRVFGPPIDADAWIIGIQNPRDLEKLSANIAIHSGALATSGDYERYFIVDGQRYCHILHPQTGFPVQYWQSVSVLAPVSIAAGSMATITMLKEDKGLEWLQQQNVAYLCINKVGEILQRELQNEY